ncbi:MAG: HDOD domain-containing protein [Gammaproteobacteria bacterium]|nr:HDOD domain-containing protein [Gammaproteobacteria bacterium]
MRIFRDESGSVDERCLPSVPTAAMRIVELAQHRECGIAELWQAVHRDPASVLALLQTARRCRRARGAHESLHAAIERLGVSRALRVCLEFRLPDAQEPVGVDYIRYWRRALLTAAYARAIAGRLRSRDLERIHVAAILRNVGDLHGGDSADWLDGQGVAANLCAWVRSSHGPALESGAGHDAAACLALAAGMAEVWLRPDWETSLAQTQALAQRLFGSIPDLCSWVFGVLGPQASDLEALAQIRLPSRRDREDLYRRAAALRQS